MARWNSADYYPGGKGTVYHKIINLMPPHEVYIEPFLGGAAIMRRKLPAQLNIGIDLDPNAPKLVLSPAGAPELEISAAGSQNGDPRRRRAPDLALADPHARNGAEDLHARNGAPVPRFHFVHGNGIDFIACYPYTGKELIYCDPPYLMSTRSGKKLYRCEMPDVDHRRLLRVLQELPTRIMISGYWSEMYAEELKTWNSISYQTKNRAQRMVTEWLWFNYPEPTELHDYRYLGSNTRQRWNMTRKKRRWTERLKRMPALERQALLAAIAGSA
jgi:DNA adenine methylase